MQLATMQYCQGRWSSLDGDLDSERTLVLAFGASEYGGDPTPLEELAQAFPRSHVVGCSTAGEIFGAKVTDHSVACAVLRFEHSEVAQASARVDSPGDSFAAGQTIATRLGAPGLRAVMVLSDGLNVNGSELVRGLNAALPDSVVVTGGLAGDGDRMQKTWVFADRAVRSGTVVGVGLCGERLCVGHGSKGGWDIFGVERVITRSAGHVLYELDGKPALELYKQYLGERAAGLPATALLFPLAIRSPGDEKVLVRTVLGISEAEQSMTFAGDVPQGSCARLMRANFDRLIHGATGAAVAAVPCGGGRGDSLCVAISCVGRRLVLGQRAEEEVEAVREALATVSGQVGFYSYGEISPYASGKCDLHNQTMTLTTISER